MLNLLQNTTSKIIEFKGIGLHSGLESKIKILPADKNNGIVFKRTDLNENNIIKANFENVSSAKLCTTIKNSFNVSVSTVEHLLAALYITGIDNALIEINAPEVPIMDGSSKEYVETILETGIKKQSAKRKYLKVLKKFEFKENEKDLSDVYTSRTFCLFEDVEKIKKLGLAKGGSLDNAIVVKENEILNSSGLRNNKEFVNHKILDLAGDFLLSGYRILGSVTCTQGGHNLSNLFLRNLLKDKSNYSIFEPEKTEKIKSYFKTSENKIAVNA
jgi:UDP-3-O-[3-hydroxymyristoyl] N-acetylglucosamine deacetylase